MREIKFKALRADGKGWVIGSLLVTEITEIFNKEEYLVKVIPETRCQYLFTNTDKIDVYENDKIKGEEEGEFYVIKWDGYGYRVDTYGYAISNGEGSQEIIDTEISVVDEDSFGVDELIECEIIGNIHDKTE